MNIRLEKVQNAAPTAENGLPVFFLRLLVVDVVEANGFGIAVFRHAAQSVRVHPQVRNRLLRSLQSGFTIFPFILFFSFFFSGVQLPEKIKVKKYGNYQCRKHKKSS